MKCNLNSSPWKFIAPGCEVSTSEIHPFDFSIFSIFRVIVFLVRYEFLYPYCVDYGPPGGTWVLNLVLSGRCSLACLKFACLCQS